MKPLTLPRYLEPERIRSNPAHPILESLMPSSFHPPARSHSRPIRSWLAGLAITGLLCAMTAPSAYAQAPEDPSAESSAVVTPVYREAMRSYLDSQGGFDTMGEQVAYGAANETLMAISNSGVEVTEAVQQIVLEEALEKYGKKFGDLDFLTDLWAAIYVNHFTLEELNEMTDFFRSAVGQKSVELFPLINQQGMTAIQEVSFSLTPAFQLAVDARLREAGISVGGP